MCSRYPAASMGWAMALTAAAAAVVEIDMPKSHRNCFDGKAINLLTKAMDVYRHSTKDLFPGVACRIFDKPESMLENSVERSSEDRLVSTIVQWVLHRYRGCCKHG